MALPPGFPAATKKGSWAYSAQLSHLLVPSRARPDTGLWPYAKALNADGHPNYVDGYLSLGLSGHGMVPGRPDDYFGISYFNFDFSDDLENAATPAINFDDETGVETYYMLSLAPAVKAGLNFQ